MLTLMLAAAVATLPSPAPTYADLATLTLASPVIVRATVAKAERVAAADAPGLAAGQARLLVTARVAAALLAPGVVPATLDYLVDLPADDRGRPPKLKDAAVLLFLRPAGDGRYALVGAKAQLDDASASAATVRAVLSEARTAVPKVTGVASAFRVPGSIPGEAESQFFLQTADGRPISLVVLSRPGAERTLQLALGDVIDEAATGVKPDTLLWYRLACFLPRDLPDGLGGDDRAGLAEDWGFVLATLGACRRTL